MGFSSQCRKCYGLKAAVTAAEKPLACRCDVLILLTDLHATTSPPPLRRLVAPRLSELPDEVDSGLGGDSPPPSPADWEQKRSIVILVKKDPTEYKQAEETLREDCDLGNEETRRDPAAPTDSPVKASNNFLMEKFLERLRHASSSDGNGHAHTAPSSPLPPTAERLRRRDLQRSSLAHDEPAEAGGKRQGRGKTGHRRSHSRLWRWLKSKTRSLVRHERRSRSVDPPPRTPQISQEHRPGPPQPASGQRSYGDSSRMVLLSANSQACLPATTATAATVTATTTAMSTARSSWADISIASSDRRPSNNNSLVAPLASAACGSSPNSGGGSIGASRDFSMESGYLSSCISTPSTPRNGSQQRQHRIGASSTVKPRLSSKSVSVDAASCEISPGGACVRSQARSFMNWRSEDHEDEVSGVCSTAKERRRQFYQKTVGNNSVFKEAVAEDDHSSDSQHPPDCEEEEKEDDLSEDVLREALGEWEINKGEVTTGKVLVDGGRFGRQVLTGRWHGDVVVHRFVESSRGSENGYYAALEAAEAAAAARRSFLRAVRALTQVRHENLVLYMGASVDFSAREYCIVTNPVRSESLHSRLQRRRLSSSGGSGCGGEVCGAANGGWAPDVEYAAYVAKQVGNALGYLHAKGIVHGRISSRNVFLEKKVQLSLLDYAVGCSNVVYSSPRVLSKCVGGNAPAVCEGDTTADDIFAFGTLLYELFAGHLPLVGEDATVVAAKIRSGSLPRSLDDLRGCAAGAGAGANMASSGGLEKLRRLISRCWDYDAARRPSFSQMAPHLAPPGMGLMKRRHSTSEPRLDQLGSNGNAPGAVVADNDDVSAAGIGGRRL